MPYAREDRKLDYSRFQIGGVQSKSGSELDAFLFTERGSIGLATRFASGSS
jgi:uncharacterized protein YfaS (alpha-2-macroglobulin family)